MEQVASLVADQQQVTATLGVVWEVVDDPNEAGPTAAAYLAVDGQSAFVLEAAIYVPEIGVTLYAAGDFAQARRLFLDVSGLEPSAFDYVREGDEWFRRVPQGRPIEYP